MQRLLGLGILVLFLLGGWWLWNNSSYKRYLDLIMASPDAQIAMPVQGIQVKQIANTFGAPRSGGRKHEGQDIFAKRGTPIYSATNGLVLSKGGNNLGGQYVMVLGAGGRRYYYAHLDRFAAGLEAGQWVTPQTVLGYVGNTGNAQTTPPHLHFGVYGALRFNEERVIDPLRLLANRNWETL